MKFLHTSDWHLGKVFHEKPLIDDQKFVLNQIISVMKMASEAGDPYAALVISGDIYDRAIPPTEAVMLLDDFLIRLTREVPDTHIFLNAGNHDGAGRLSFAARFLAQNNIHLVTDTADFTTPVIVRQGDEQCAFYQLPFLAPLSIKRSASSCQAKASDREPSGSAAVSDELLRTQQALYEEAVAQIAAAHKASYADIPAVLNAHLFASGCSTGASERSNVGTLEQVGADIFTPFAYGAFGHIHKCQPVGRDKRCWYSGALLAYNFDDDPETGMNEVTLVCTPSSDGQPAGKKCAENASVSVRRIPFKALHPVAKVTAEMKELTGSSADTKLIAENRDNYVQVILTDEVMPLEAFTNLKSVFPNLMSVMMKAQSGSARSSSIEARKSVMDSRDPSSIFDQFMKDIFGEIDGNELIAREKQLFVQEAAGIEDEPSEIREMKE